MIGAGGHRCPVARALGDVSEARGSRGGAGERDPAAARVGLAPRAVPARARALRRARPPRLRLVLPEAATSSISASGAPRAATAACPGGATRWWPPCAPPAGCPTGCRIEPFKGHAYVVRRQAPRRLSGPRFCLIGDAAGLARDLSGEGIGPAIRSGRLAAEAVTRPDPPGRCRSTGTRGRSWRRYGPGEPGWLQRKLVESPGRAGPARGARVLLGSEAARRRIVFDSIFGMREVAP